MSKSQFTVAYDGPALQEGRMDVRELAPALLALGQLFDAANQVLNGDSAKVSVRVVATQQACFEISLDVVQSLSSQITAFLVGQEVTAAVNLIGLITGGGGACGGLFWLIKKLKGGKPDAITKKGDTCVIVFGEDQFEVPFSVIRLYQDIAVRKAARAVIAPIGRDGITEFMIREHGETVLPLSRDDLPAFVEPEIPDELVIEQTIKAAYSIVSLAFKEDNKWRLFDGNATISALIEDAEFLRRVDENLVCFFKGDILVCNVRVRQMRGKEGLKTEHIVEEVIDHHPGARQLSLGL